MGESVGVDLDRLCAGSLDGCSEVDERSHDSLYITHGRHAAVEADRRLRAILIACKERRVVGSVVLDDLSQAVAEVGDHRLAALLDLYIPEAVVAVGVGVHDIRP